ncbi:MAG: hypothetical protein GY827_08260, partial [Cytophagales bacterium]|nr:hypothetical protein [Cytophagales bacterium]
MKRYIGVFLLLLFCLGGYMVVSKDYFFDTKNPEKFVKDVVGYLKSQENKKAQKAAKNFQKHWDQSQMTPKQQKMFIHFSKLLRDKRYQVYPYMTDALDAIYYGTNNQELQGAKVDTLIFTMYKTVKNYDKRIGQRFITTMKNFMNNRALFMSDKFNLYATKGSFKIRFVDEEANVLEGEEELDIEHADSFEELDESAEEMAEKWNGLEEEGNVDEEVEDDEYNDDEYNDDEEIENEDGYDESLLAGNESIGYVEPTPHLQEGPVIDLTGVDLVFLTRHDSTAIKRTNGSITMNDYIFMGEGGEINWTMAGLAPDVKGNFKKYKFKANVAHLTAEGFTLNYPSKITEPVEGIFELASKKHTSNGNTDFPRFMSYEANVEIKDLGENIKYNGGFSLRGASVYSSSVNGGNGTIEVMSQGELKFRSKAQHFVLSDSIIHAEPASIVIYQGNDSIFHPGVLLDFNRNTEDLKIYREKSHFKYSPYVDTYHEMDMDIDAIYWNLSDTVMNFTMVNARQLIPAYFDSKDNYQLQKYVQLKGIYPFHALQMAVNYGERKRKRAFYAADLAEEYKQKESQVRGAMVGLMRRGYIAYNTSTGYIFLKEKAFHYVESRKGKKDYDQISIKAISPGSGSHARLNLNSNELKVKGVDQVTVSDSLGVYFQPNERELTVKEDRDMEFNGTVFTDVYVFKGEHFKMSYDTFSIKLTKIDSIQFSVAEIDTITGEEIGRRKLDNQLTYASGTLYIDDPNNKSGKEHNAQYPYFEATQGAYVYFLNVLDQAYDSTIFYKVPPFRTDSMGGSTEAATTFNGTFHSGGIFPVIEQELKAMPDYSLGFIHQVPEEGYPLYEGDGRFFGELSMTSQGLRGKGKIKYLNTELESDDFIFYMDSVVTRGTITRTEIGNNPLVADSITYPGVSVHDYALKWLPRKDSMLISNNEEKISLYDSTSVFDGTMIVSKKGMFGIGHCLFEGAEIHSNDFTFHDIDFGAHDAEFDILSNIEGQPALRSQGVKIDVDLKESVAHFSPEEEGKASNEFPSLYYKSSLDQGTWNMEEHTVIMTVPEGMEDISKSYLYSTHPDEDSLAFSARKVIYSMDSLTLDVQGIPYINVGEARIVPGNNEVFINQEERMRPFSDAVITIDTLNQYHRLFDGNIEVLSRSRFEGQATYAYRNIQGDTLPIKFNKFELVEEKLSRKKTITYTLATGHVFEQDSFLIGPRMQYKGQATMYSNKRLLDLEGEIKIKLKGTVSQPDWLVYENKEDIDEIRIDLENQPEPQNGKTRYVGLHFSSSYRTYYGTFVGPKTAERDFTVFSATGTAIYDEKHDQFDVGPLLRLREDSLGNKQYEGGVFIYNEGEDMFDYDGNFKLLLQTSNSKEGIALDFAGHGKNKILDTTLSLKGMGFIQYDIPALAYDAMGLDVKNMSAGLSLPPALDNDGMTDTLYANIANLSDEKTVRKYIEKSKVAYVPLNTASKEFSKGILLSHVNLEWSKKHKSWYSTGKIGISGIGKHDINSEVTGYLEVKPSADNNKVVLYLELEEGYWYYFTFHKNKLETVGYKQEYNDAISSKAKEQKYDEYALLLGEERQARRFVRRFREVYWGDTLQQSEEIEDSFEEESEEAVEEESPVEEESVEEEESLEDVLSTEEESEEAVEEESPV